jgi:membrane-associated protease RseP (regulator of RpoE activity)
LVRDSSRGILDRLWRELAGFNDRRGTRWKLSAIPLGGYVRFEGDENAASLPDAEALARVPESERHGLFYFAPLWKRMAVGRGRADCQFHLAILVFAAVFTNRWPTACSSPGRKRDAWERSGARRPPRRRPHP